MVGTAPFAHGRFPSMRMLHAVPALPVQDIPRSVTFYRDKLGWTVVHQQPGFAIVERDQVALHLWAAADESWRTRASASPVVSGAESFIAGTASCRVHVDGIDGLYRSLDPLGILHPDGNLITFAEPVPAAEPA